MKKIFALLMATMLLLSTIAVSAETLEKEITVTYNGQLISFDTTPQIINDRTMVPFRGIFETIGAEVSFDESTRTVLSTKDDTNIAFKIGETQAEITTNENTETIALDAAPVIIDDRTLVPVRFVAESLGATVVWDAAYREVVIADTSVWKKEIKENCEFLDVLLNASLFTEDAFTSTEEAEMKLSLSVKNLGEAYADGITGPENIDVSLNIKTSEKAVFDTKAVNGTCAIEADLSSIGELLKSFEIFTEEEAAVVDALLKKHNINIEIIVDDNFNIYLKSKEIVDLISLFDEGKIASAIGDNYILIPLGEALADIIPEDFNLQIENMWDLIDIIVKNGELDTAAVQMFDTVIDMMANIYNDETITSETKADGTTVYKIAITKDAYINIYKNFMETIYTFEGMTEEEKVIIDGIIAEQLKMLENMEYSIEGEFEYKDGMFTKATAKGMMSITDFKIPETENVLMGMNFEMSAQSAIDTVSEVPTVVIPQNVIDITK